MAREQQGSLAVVPPRALMEMTEGSVPLCVCLGLPGMGSESVRWRQLLCRAVLPSLRNTKEEADADLAGNHPRCAAATWCHRLPQPQEEMS